MHAGIKFWKSICLLSTKNNYLKNLSFNYSYPHSSPINLPCTTQSPPPTFNPPPQPRCLCPWVLYTCSLTWPFPFFPPLELPQLELQLLALQHTAICSVTLAWPWTNACKKLACWNCSSARWLILAFFFLSSYFFWIFLDHLFVKISSSSGVSLAPSFCSGAVPSGTQTTVGAVCCQWAQCCSLVESWCGPVCGGIHFRQQ